MTQEVGGDMLPSRACMRRCLRQVFPLDVERMPLRGNGEHSLVHLAGPSDLVIFGSRIITEGTSWFLANYIGRQQFLQGFTVEAKPCVCWFIYRLGLSKGFRRLTKVSKFRLRLTL